MTLTLNIRLFGGFALTYGDQPLVGINTLRSASADISKRSQILLSYLVLHRHTPQLRSSIAFHLWADSTDTQARTNLRKELYQLRHNLPNAEQFLLIESKTLQWSPTAPFTLDVLKFENAVKAAEDRDPDTMQSLLQQAIALYQGALLPDCEDEWIQFERDRLQQMCVRAFEQLIDLLKQRQDYRLALTYAQQLLRLDSLNESTYCTLMQIYALSGDRANALQVYHRCMTMLREELGVDPSATTRKLYEQLLREDETREDKAPPPPATRSRSSFPARHALPPLVGREPEWQIIQQWASETSHPASSEILLLFGESGIGKTRLLEELRATMQTGQVLWGQAFAAERVRPYGIWIDALRSLALPSTVRLSKELGFLLPEVGQPTTTPLDRSHLFDAVVQLLAEWAHQAPLVVILDDLQWIDEASSALLHYAIRLLSHLPVRFACTARAAEIKENAAVSQVVQTLRRERRLKIVELSPLNRGQTATLIRNLNAVEPTNLSVEVIDQVFTDSGGNPLFALEITRALSQKQSTQMDDLQALIGDRLQQLDESAREVLPWAAALGRSFKPTMVAQVAVHPLPKLLTSIEQLEQQSIIRPSLSIENEMGYDFAHDIVRRVVYQQISEPRRRLLHYQIAQTLRQTIAVDEAVAVDVAHHAALGGDFLLATASSLTAAQRSLKLFAYSEAAELAQRGIQDCQHLDDRSRIPFHVKLLQVFVLTGVPKNRVAQVEAELHQLIAEANRLGLQDEEAIALEALIALNFDHGNITGVHEHSLRASERGRAGSPTTMARMLAYTGWCLAEIERDVPRAEALLLEAQSLAARVGQELMDVQCGLGIVRYYKADWESARLLLEQAWRIAQASQDHWRECICLKYLAMLELESGHMAASLSYSRSMATVATQMGEASTEGAIATALTLLVHYAADPIQHAALLEQVLSRLNQLDDQRVCAYTLIFAAEIDLQHQRIDRAIARARSALTAARVVDHASCIVLAWIAWVRGLLASGDREQAIATFTTLQQQTCDRAISVRARTAQQQLELEIKGERDGSRFS